MRTLLVTEERSFAGGAQHPLLRWYYRVSFALLRWILGRAVARLSHYGKVIVLTTRSLAPNGFQRNEGVTFRFYDAVQEQLPYRKLREGVWMLVRKVTELLRGEPICTVEGVLLPKVTETQLALHLLSGVLKYEAILENLIEEVKPDRIVTLSRVAAPELVAHHLAERKGIEYGVLPSFGVAQLAEHVERALRRREKVIWHTALRRIAHEPAADSPRTGEVFFISSHATHHLKTLVPLAHKLEERHHLPAMLFQDLPQLLSRMRQFGEVPSRWSSVVHFLPRSAFAEDLPRAYRRFGVLWERLRQKTPFAEYPLTVATPFLTNLFQYEMALAAVLVPCIRRLFSERKPRAVITASDRRYNEVLFPMIAKQFGVPSILATAITNMSLEMANNYDTCDAVAVVGSSIRDLLLGIGHDPERVQVVGDLRFDDLPERARSLQPARLKQKLGIASEKRLILLISSDIGPTWTESKKRNLFQTVFRQVAKLPDAVLLVKSHPNESLLLLSAHLQSWGMGTVPVSFQENLHDLILAADIVVMLYSMAGLEAMLLGRPVLNVTLEGEDVEHYIPYVTGGGAWGVKSEAELGDALRTLLANSETYARWAESGKHFSARFIHPVDGKVSDRIVALIHALERTPR